MGSEFTEGAMSTRHFDLNIERVLEHWTTVDALRELIANALDEAAITGTGEPEIAPDGADWLIRDFGRGLRYDHFTQNESDEKLNHTEVVGQFGVGLKDAAATLHRREVQLQIRSRHNDIALTMSPKADFGEVSTLHAEISPPSDPNLRGTEIRLTGIDPGDMEDARRLFLRFSGDEVIEVTPHGEVVECRADQPACIYVRGVRVAQDEGFLFSYNLTSLNKRLRESLNRERSNVGRQAYTDRVKAVLLSAESETVAQMLTEDLGQFTSGHQHDETSWVDVAIHASKILNASDQVVFVTADELESGQAHLEYARREGLRIVTVPDRVHARLRGEKDVDGRPIRDLDEYITEWQDRFEYEFVDEAHLTDMERKVFSITEQIYSLACLDARWTVSISETMQPAMLGNEVLGCWDPDGQRIVIRRDQLRSVESFAGILLHEIVHASTGTNDLTFEFEDALTEILGRLTASILR
jgi:hypothetical protein